MLGEAAVGAVEGAELHVLAGHRGQRHLEVAPLRVLSGEGRRSRGILRQRLAVERAVESRPRLATIVGGLEVRVVEALLDRVADLRRQRGVGLAAEGEIRRHRVGEVVTHAGPELLLARSGSTVVDGDVLLRQHDHGTLGLVGVVLLRAEVEGLLRARGHRLVVEPAQLQLVPGTEVAGTGAEWLVLGVQPALRHQRPVLAVVVATTGRVVVVRQPEVVPVLVREDRQTAVLRLHRVVADPDAGVADRGAPELVEPGPGEALVGDEGVPAVRPDRVLALLGIAVGLVAAGVHDLEVVDVAVGLVEVAVAVVVVAVVLVVRRDGLLDLGVGLAGRLLVGHPRGDRVLDQVPGGLGRLVTAVASLVVGNLDPVRDRAVDGVAAGRLLLVVRLDRLGLVALGEVEVLVVPTGVVALPDGGVVLRPVRLGDLVAHRALERRRTGHARIGVLVGEVRVPLVAELGEDHEDLVGALLLELDVLVLGLGVLGCLPLLRRGLLVGEHRRVGR